jgi:hypothetical protein
MNDTTPETRIASGTRHAAKSLRIMVVAGWAMLLLVVATPVLASAQALDDVEITFYGYFSADASTVLSVGHMKPANPALAGELVSPQYADDFFGGFTLFTNHEFAGDLASEYIAQIDDAEEYMVFKGTLDFVDGAKPGYLTFLSTSQQVFLIYGYQSDAADLFGLAAQIIRDGDVPTEYAGYTRMELSDAGDVDGVQPSSASKPASAPRAQPTQAPARTSSGAQDQSAAVVSDPNAYIGESVVVSGNVAVITQDTDGTTYILIASGSGGFLVGYPGKVSGVSEGDRVTVTGVVIGAEDVEGELLPLILASEVD